jgi:radical SAM protein with 4Fe4S-binding SPASM domain
MMPESAPTSFAGGTAQMRLRSFESFAALLHQSARARHLPLSGSFELTYRCNFGCVHCFEQGLRDTHELSTARWLRLVDAVAEQGCLWLALTGGEPTLHPGFEAIYERAIRRGLLVTVLSNGSTLTESMARLFERLPPRSIEVTLYGASPETYQSVTGSADNYRLAWDGAKRLVRLGLAVQIKTVVFDETRVDFETIRDYAHALGASFRFDTTIHGALASGAAPTQHRLVPAQIVEVEALDEKPFADVRARHGQPQYRGSDRVFRCGAGRYAFTVAPDGYLQACTLLRSRRIDLGRVDFAEAWRALGEEVERRYREGSPCNGCELQHMCGTCPGIAQLQTGDPEAIDAHICRTTHLRAAAALGKHAGPGSGE